MKTAPRRLRHVEGPFLRCFPTFMSSRVVSTLGFSRRGLPQGVTFWPSFKSMAMPDKDAAPGAAGHEFCLATGTPFLI